MGQKGFYRYRGEAGTDRYTVDLPQPEFALVAAVLPAVGGDLEGRACMLLEEDVIRPPGEYPRGGGLHPEWVTRAEDVEEELCRPMTCDAEDRWKELNIMAVDSDGEWYDYFSPRRFLDEWHVELPDYRVLVFRFWHTRE